MLIELKGAAPLIVGAVSEHQLNRYIRIKGDGGIKKRTNWSTLNPAAPFNLEKR
jgi:hypothetical protein